MSTDPIEVLIEESWETYHKNRATNLSSHQLGDFRECPLLYDKKKRGLIEDKDRPAFIIGRAFHCWLLEPDAFQKRYVVGGPVNPKTGEPFGRTTKAFAGWKAEQEAEGLEVITKSDYELIESLAKGVEQNKEAVKLLSSGYAERVGRHDVLGVPCQIRIDWFNPKRGIVDVKTADNLKWFHHDARRYGYIHQLAFYQDVYAQLMGKMCGVHIIGVEKQEPYRCGVWRISTESLGIAKHENRAAIEYLKKCQEKNDWPTGYEKIRELQVFE